MDEFTMAFSCDVFLRKKRWKDRHGFQNEMQKNELELHSFEEEYEKVSTVFTDGMTVRDARMTHAQNET